mmetsp:Transcript_22662/g.40933  ORF Transcript_22662/g.40933 Transcript_22662/m.40933 type:complete len:102 (-) Transcript_22662:713-1018(-)
MEELTSVPAEDSCYNETAAVDGVDIFAVAVVADKDILGGVHSHVDGRPSGEEHHRCRTVRDGDMGDSRRRGVKSMPGAVPVRTAHFGCGNSTAERAAEVLC